eukprot:scaffold639_cov304-Pinguiococcus_pyrenoidosus.AAC.3
MESDIRVTDVFLRMFDPTFSPGTFVAALEQGITREVVRCPPDERKEEWLAVHVVDFYNDLNALTMIIEDCCTVSSCPVMGAGDYTYLWADGVTVVEPMKVPAPLYIQFLFNWCDQKLSDETLFPQATRETHLRRKPQTPGRCGVSGEFCGGVQGHDEADVSRLCAHVPQPLRRLRRERHGGAPQHLLQVVHPLLAGAPPCAQTRAAAAGADHREADGSQGGQDPQEAGEAARGGGDRAARGR